MALNRFGFLVTGNGMDPRKNRMTMKEGSFEMIVVGMSTPDQAPAIAEELVADGIQLIELCGGFGPVWTAKVIEAVGARIPVGSVGYGPESISSMYRLFSD